MVASFLRRFFLIDLLKGLWLTLRYTPQPAFTFQYPLERRPVAPRFRGVLRLQDKITRESTVFRKERWIPAGGTEPIVVEDRG